MTDRHAYQGILKSVIGELVRLVPDLDGDIHEDSKFIDELELDSLHMIDLVANLETLYEVKFPPEIESTGTPGELATEISRTLENLQP